MKNSDLMKPCPDCRGDNEECETCDGRGEVPRKALAPADDDAPVNELAGDREPLDIDDDRFTDPYTGATYDDGYDTGGDW